MPFWRIKGPTRRWLIRYGLPRMKRLRPYLNHGFLELDNNTAERAM